MKTEEFLTYSLFNQPADLPFCLPALAKNLYCF